MDELLAGILGAILEFLLEAFLEVIAAAILDVISRALVSLFGAVKQNRVLTSILYALLGALAGALSILILPHPLIHREHRIRLHGISLLVSPFITGFVLSFAGGILRRLGKKVTPLETFGYGFAFALAMALIRFFFAK